MDTKALKSRFARIGADLRVRQAAQLHPWRRPSDYSIGVTKTGKGECFDLVLARDDLEIRVVDADALGRHLLLLVKGRLPSQRSKFLCGHDERHWFIATVDAAVNSVGQAKESLKPRAVRTRQDQAGVKAKSRNRRRNKAFIRQGEWVFVPVPDLEVDERLVLHDEPIRRGSGKPHMVEFLYRLGGVAVRVSTEYPNGLTEAEFADLMQREPHKAHLVWRNMIREPDAFARGRIRHPDHKTVLLGGWHQILPNTESHTRLTAINDGSLAFLD